MDFFRIGQQISNFSFFKLLQARKIKLCMVANEKCTSKEILKREVFNKDSERMLIIPEFVQDLDKSDGSEQFDDDIKISGE
jgi:hypothetical protein